MTQKPARFVATKSNRATLAETLGLKAADLDPTLPLEFVSTGIPNLMVPIRNRKTLSKIHVNMRGLAQLISRNGVLAYCFALGREGKRSLAEWCRGDSSKIPPLAPQAALSALILSSTSA